MSLDGTNASLPEFEALVRELHKGGIYVGMQSSRHGIAVWVTDQAGLRRQDHLIEVERTSAAWPDVTAARWVHDTVLQLFPSSVYAKRQLTTQAKHQGPIGAR
jgi:hypothetical protein